ncbi:hypothetical protein C8F04DRAFT_1198131 [Mycena alexandri]|uniref:Uncharacterized protein n=1 Tax=Mycena alexandri TaxID=1745969 RepID=A0AAD6WND9_9AGAR|nr:hypothetical protein C8F04DRAFT_1198131 [Mycena alexandri]
MIPPELRALPEPPSEFVACAVPEHTGHNFLSHPHFSSKQNKTYWLLLGPLNEGVYTLKSVSAPFGEGRRTDQHIEQIACARKGEWGWRHRRRFFVATFAEWKDVVAFWQKFCFHRHRKCRSHPMACVRGCPTHERQVVEDTRPDPKIKKKIVVVKNEPTVKKEPTVKREPTVEEEGSVSAGAVKQQALTPAVKQEPAGTATKRKAEPQSPGNTPVKGGTRRAPHARKAPTLSYAEPSDDDAGSVDSDFFFLPDSPSPSAGQGKATEATRGPTPERTEVRATAEANTPTSRATSPTISTVSSLSASSLAASKLDAKGKGRAVSRAPAVASSSRNQPLANVVGGRGKHNFGRRRQDERGLCIQRLARWPVRHHGWSIYRGVKHLPCRPRRCARGAVHHSREQAFSDISVGPIQPVVGYDAAITYADSLILAQDGATSEERMDLDAREELGD